jgi:preprotein translocase subunit SecY
VTSTVPNLFKVPELKEKLLFTLLCLVIYRIGAHIATPGVNVDALTDFMSSRGSGTLFGLYDLFSGGSLRRATVFALGIMPYISASIVFQLAGPVFPIIEKMQRDEEGKKTLTQWTRYLTVVLCLFQAYGFALFTESLANAVPHPGFGFRMTTVLTLTTGGVFVMWLGEQITERGIGNGISLLIFAGIVIGLPTRGVPQVIDRVRSGDTLQVLGVLGLVVALLVLIAFIVYVESGRRKVPISYAKRHIGRQMVGGQQTHMPLKINMAGVIPVIFASSMLAFPQTIVQFIQFDATQPDSWRYKLHLFFQQFHGGDPYYELIFLSLIVIFTFFYITIIFNVEEVADNLRKHGGFIPGIRPGRNTAEYLNTILTRLTTVGAIYLALVAFLPQLMLSGFRVGRLPFIGATLDAFLSNTPGLGWIPTGMGYQFYFGGTSLLILVGVAMDTVSQVEAQLVMRNYEGFLGGGSRLRGRRT